MVSGDEVRGGGERRGDGADGAKAGFGWWVDGAPPPASQQSQGTLLGQQMPATATTTTTTAHEGAPAHEGGSSAADASAPGGSTQAALFARLLDSVESFRKQAPAQRSRNLDSARNSLVDGAAAAQEAAAVLAAAASDDCQLGIRDHQLLDVVCPPPSIEESLSALWGWVCRPGGEEGGMEAALDRSRARQAC